MARQRNPLTNELMIEGVTAVMSERTGAITFRGRVTYTDGAGVRRFVAQTHKTYEAAEAWKLETELQVRRGTYATPTPLTVGDVWERWFARKSRSWAVTTRERTARDWTHHLGSELATVRVDRVTRDDLHRLIERLEAKRHTKGMRKGEPILSASSIRLIMTSIRGMFHFAYREQLIAIDPAIALDLPKPEPDPVPVWSPLQLRRFLSGMREESSYPFWYFVASTGCRIGEAMALRVSDVRGRHLDPNDRPSVWIHRTFRIVNGQATYDEGTKTSKAGHVVNLELDLYEVLMPLLERRPGSAFVFLTTRGVPYTMDSARWSLRTAIARLGLPRISPKGFRHSAATMMIANQVPHNVVASMLGHKGPRTTLTTYAHVGSDEQRIGTATMARLLGRDADTTTSGDREAK